MRPTLVYWRPVDLDQIERHLPAYSEKPAARGKMSCVHQVSCTRCCSALSSTTEPAAIYIPIDLSAVDDVCQPKCLRLAILQRQCPSGIAFQCRGRCDRNPDRLEIAATKMKFAPIPCFHGLCGRIPPRTTWSRIPRHGTSWTLMLPRRCGFFVLLSDWRARAKRCAASSAAGKLEVS